MVGFGCWFCWHKTIQTNNTALFHLLQTVLQAILLRKVSAYEQQQQQQQQQHGSVRQDLYRAFHKLCHEEGSLPLLLLLLLLHRRCCRCFCCCCCCCIVAAVAVVILLYFRFFCCFTIIALSPQCCIFVLLARCTQVWLYQTWVSLSLHDSVGLGYLCEKVTPPILH